MQAIGRQPQRPPDGAPVHDERHRPEQTTLDRLVQQHAATFFAQAEDAAGADLPPFFKDEFEAFLECGILAHGLLRLRCGGCGHDKLVAFSCKRRGFCPSCGARRVAQTAAELIDHVNAGNLHDQPPRVVRPRRRTAGAAGPDRLARRCHRDRRRRHRQDRVGAGRGDHGVRGSGPSGGSKLAPLPGAAQVARALALPLRWRRRMTSGRGRAGAARQVCTPGAGQRRASARGVAASRYAG